MISSCPLEGMKDGRKGEKWETVARGLIQGRAGPSLQIFMLGWVCVGKEQSSDATLRLVPMILFFIISFSPFFKVKKFSLETKRQITATEMQAVFDLSFTPRLNYQKSVYLVFFLLLNIFLQSRMQILDCKIPL